MGSERHVRVSTEIGAPAARVWERISDHEATPSWVSAVKRVTLVEPGEPRNGVGAVRVVEFKPRSWTKIHERILRFDAPTGFDYVLFKGMPGLKSHLGTLTVEQLDDERSRLRWDVDFVFRTLHPFRPFVTRFLRDFEAVLSAGVVELKAQLEQPDRSGRSRLRRLLGRFRRSRP
jgi:uncharacterized protein YndB with AHSA1/START domain